MPRMTRAEYDATIKGVYERALYEGVQKGKRDAAEEFKAKFDRFKAQVELVQSIARITEANATLTQAVHHMVDEGLLKGI